MFWKPTSQFAFYQKLISAALDYDLRELLVTFNEGRLTFIPDQN